MNRGFIPHGLKKTFLIVIATLFLPSILAAQNAASGMGEQYTVNNLVSSVIGPTENGDSSLVNPWGIACSSTGGPWWVVDKGKGRATVYSEAGISFPGLAPLVVAIPATPSNMAYNSTPTGIVFNSTTSFQLAAGVPSQFIFVTGDGAIAGWSSAIGRYNAVLVVDNYSDAAYTGVAIGSINGENVLYSANFRQGRVDIFGRDFGPRFLSPNAFTDLLMPEDFSPYNVQNINGRIYVAYAKPGAEGTEAEIGAGSGYVDAFDRNGNLIMRFMEGPWMNAPWGIAQAPMGFGDYSGFLLVGNSGSGRIAAFDMESGDFVGYLRDRQGMAITIPGLHALSFGNNGLAGPASTLYFSADNSIFGLIRADTTVEESYSRPLTEPYTLP